MLFISAYVPLFVLEAVIIFRPPTTAIELLIYALISIAAIVLLGGLFWQFEVWLARDHSVFDYEVLGYANEEAKSMTLLAPYVSLFFFSLGTDVTLFVLFILLFVIFVAHFHSDLLFLNLVLIVWGYRFYRIDARIQGLHEDTFSSLLVSKNARFQKNSLIAVKVIDVGVVFEERGEKRGKHKRGFRLS